MVPNGELSCMQMKQEFTQEAMCIKKSIIIFCYGYNPDIDVGVIYLRRKSLLSYIEFMYKHTHTRQNGDIFGGKGD